MSNEVELSVVMPCLDESETLATCIRKAKKFFKDNNIAGEVIVADNGSTDGSQEITISEGAVLVNVEEKGYGSAIWGGIQHARGKYIIMGDSDDSYDFLNLSKFVENLREGYDLVMGNRFKGGIKKKAMPFLHRYIGNPVLSLIGRLFFKINIRDFHCGLRGFSKEAIMKMGLRTKGMEFASEIVVKASLLNMKITEVPTILSPDGRTRKPHLNTWRDGWHHLRFLLMYSPKWLFLYPGIILFIISGIIFCKLVYGKIYFENHTLDIHSLTYFGFGLIFSYQLIIFSLFSKIYAVNQGLMPVSIKFKNIFKYFTLEKGLILGMILLFIGIILTIDMLLEWKTLNFGIINDIGRTFRKIIPSIVFMSIGLQTIFSSFFLSILGIIQKDIYSKR